MVAVAGVAVVVTATLAVVDPAAMVTLAGTVTTELLLASVIVAPPLGAALDRFSVAVTVVPPATVACDNARLESVAVVVVGVVVDPVQAAAGTEIRIVKTAGVRFTFSHHRGQ